MVNRRNARRKKTIHLTMVFNAKTDRVLGRLVNITPDGMMVVVNAEQECDQELLVRIVLPTMVNDRTDIELQARLVWCKRDANPDYYNSGFQFLNVSSEDAEVISSVMHKLNLVG